MLPASMQDAIRAKAANRGANFQDPYVKPKMTKEEYLAAKSGGRTAALGGDTPPSIDVSALLQGQHQLQRQITHLSDQVASMGGGSSIGGVSAEQWTAFQREMRQAQRQAHNELLSQMEDLLREALSSTKQTTTTPASSLSSATAATRRLEREVAELKEQVNDLQQENRELRRKLEEQKKNATSSSSASTPRSQTTSSAPSGVTRAKPSASSSGELEVQETSKEYQLSLNCPGIKLEDLSISYGSGALELEVKGGKKYSFEVASSKIDTGSISATLQPNGKLEISVAKKK